MRIRIDVDYPYPSRIRSFIYTTLRIRTSRRYLENSKIVAQMINESKRNVKAYWFFTFKTVPDKELLCMLDNPKHSVGLHVVNNPYKELKTLEQRTGKKATYYSIHGTSRLLARIMWKRWRSKAPKIPEGFPLQLLHRSSMIGLDKLGYAYPAEQAQRMAEDAVRHGNLIYFHPIWLFQRGKMNHRGPFYHVLQGILGDGN